MSKICLGRCQHCFQNVDVITEGIFDTFLTSFPSLATQRAILTGILTDSQFLGTHVTELHEENIFTTPKQPDADHSGGPYPHQIVIYIKQVAQQAAPERKFKLFHVGCFRYVISSSTEQMCKEEVLPNAIQKYAHDNQYSPKMIPAEIKFENGNVATSIFLTQHFEQVEISKKYPNKKIRISHFVIRLFDYVAHLNQPDLIRQQLVSIINEFLSAIRQTPWLANNVDIASIKQNLTKLSQWHTLIDPALPAAKVATATNQLARLHDNFKAFKNEIEALPGQDDQKFLQLYARHFALFSEWDNFSITTGINHQEFMAQNQSAINKINELVVSLDSKIQAYLNNFPNHLFKIVEDFAELKKGASKLTLAVYLKKLENFKLLRITTLTGMYGNNPFNRAFHDFFSAILDQEISITQELISASPPYTYAKKPNNPYSEITARHKLLNDLIGNRKDDLARNADLIKEICIFLLFCYEQLQTPDCEIFESHQIGKIQEKINHLRFEDLQGNIDVLLEEFQSHHSFYKAVKKFLTEFDAKSPLFELKERIDLIKRELRNLAQPNQYVMLEFDAPALERDQRPPNCWGHHFNRKEKKMIFILFFVILLCCLVPGFSILGTFLYNRRHTDGNTDGLTTGFTSATSGTTHYFPGLTTGAYPTSTASSGFIMTANGSGTTASGYPTGTTMAYKGTSSTDTSGSTTFRSTTTTLPDGTTFRSSSTTITPTGTTTFGSTTVHVGSTGLTVTTSTNGATTLAPGTTLAATSGHTRTTGITTLTETTLVTSNGHTTSLGTTSFNTSGSTDSTTHGVAPTTFGTSAALPTSSQPPTSFAPLTTAAQPTSGTSAKPIHTTGTTGTPHINPAWFPPADQSNLLSVWKSQFWAPVNQYFGNQSLAEFKTYWQSVYPNESIAFSNCLSSNSYIQAFQAWQNPPVGMSVNIYVIIILAQY